LSSPRFYSFDFQGRQLSREDFNRRVVRWEHDGSMTIIADFYDGKPLNSPNDIVAQPDGSIWFTDPPYGGSLAEGHPDDTGGPSNPQGIFNPLIGAANAGAKGGESADCRPTPTVGIRAASSRWRSWRSIARPEWHLFFARLQDALRDQHRQGSGRHRARR
jgi:hypothetical protein